MAKHEFKGNQSAKGKGLDKNPQNINKTGKNRRSFATINNDLKAKGIEPLTKTALVEAYSLIFNSTAEELEKIKEDPKTPFVLQLIIKELDGNGKTKAIADYRDYQFGRAEEKIDLTSKGLPITGMIVK